MIARKPLIVVGVPCYGTVAPELLEDWCRWFYHLGRRMPDYDFCLAIKTKSEQFRARNAIVEAAQQMNADWLLMIDDDMIVNAFVTSGPTEEYGFLAQLLAHDKDICGALYYQRVGECRPVLMTAVPSGGYRFLRDEEIEHTLQRVDVAGGGCLLIKMRVFDHLPSPYFKPEFAYGTDIQLCAAAAAKGYEVWADTSVELGHLRTEHTIVTSRNRHQFTLTDTVPGEVKRTFVSTGLFEDLVRDAVQYTGYEDVAAMTRVAQSFLSQRTIHRHMSDAEWYRMFPTERVARQVWFNTQSTHKRQMTEYILATINHTAPLRILDFGCGIGIPAFYLAEKGHHVTALDIAGTGTLEFLKWRAARHEVPLTVVESDGELPDFSRTLLLDPFDVIIAMDSIEHVTGWRELVPLLADHLVPGGVLFANNAILEDDEHPEHKDITPNGFLAAVVAAQLRPLGQITYMKSASAAPVKELTHAS